MFALFELSSCSRVLKNVTIFVQYLQILLSRVMGLVRIRMDPYYFRKLDPDPDPH
jgi:hypothetical protein